MRIIFITSFWRAYIQRSANNLFEHEKLSEIIDTALPTEQSIKSFTFIFQSFCLNLKSAFSEV